MAGRREEIRNLSELIGYIETDSSGNRTAYDKYMTKLGTYTKNNNRTATVHGTIIGYGDLTAVLIWNKIS